MGNRNRDTVSLPALWDLTGDEGILPGAAGKFRQELSARITFFGFS